MWRVQARNEELARKSAAISEEDLEAMRGEFEARLGAAERKVYALTKERDALRRGADKLNSANDLVKEKDAIIQQVSAPLVPGIFFHLLDLKCFCFHDTADPAKSGSFDCRFSSMSGCGRSCCAQRCWAEYGMRRCAKRVAVRR